MQSHAALSHMKLMIYFSISFMMLKGKLKSAWTKNKKAIMLSLHLKTKTVVSVSVHGTWFALTI